MKPSLILALTSATSLTAYWLGRRNGFPLRALGYAATRAVECMGLTLVFLLGNLGLGLATVLVMRTMPLPFVSAYVLNDLALVVISALQAVILHWWWVASGSDALRTEAEASGCGCQQV